MDFFEMQDHMMHIWALTKKDAEFEFNHFLNCRLVPVFSKYSAVWQHVIIWKEANFVKLLVVVSSLCVQPYWRTVTIRRTVGPWNLWESIPWRLPGVPTRWGKASSHYTLRVCCAFQMVYVTWLSILSSSLLPVDCGFYYYLWVNINLKGNLPT